MTVLLCHFLLLDFVIVVFDFGHDARENLSSGMFDAFRIAEKRRLRRADLPCVLQI